jgi:hypothetical protein
LRLSGLIALLLRCDIGGESLALRFRQRPQAPAVKGRIKREAGGVKLFDNREIQALLRHQYLNVALSMARRNRSVQQGLTKMAAGETKRLKRRFAGAFAALQSPNDSGPRLGQAMRSKNQATAGGLLQAEFRFPDG